MPPSYWNQRFFTSTRGRIVMLLRRASRTVDELAQALDLTDNAVRAHLATLERDGVVQQRGARRGPGKPAYIYNLAPEAEQFFPKAYGQVLHQLLEVLNELVTPQQLESLIRATGRRLAAQWNVPPAGDLPTRLELAIHALNELGGLAELEQHDQTYTIHGYSCPFAAAVPGHPEICHLAETLLTELTGLPIQQHCESGEIPQCCFVVPAT